MSVWALRPLLELRRREEQVATTALAQAERAQLQAEAEVAARRQAASSVAASALDGAAGRWPAAGWLGPSLGEAGRWAERQRLEAARLARLVEQAEARARAEAGVVATRREALRKVAVRHEAVRQLEADWRRAAGAAAARRDEAAIDDRPWRQERREPARFSASRPAAGRRAPVGTGW